MQHPETGLLIPGIRTMQDTRAAGAEFDMFAEEGQDAAAAMTDGDKASAAAGLADSYDDPDGYYNLQVLWCCEHSHSCLARNV